MLLRIPTLSLMIFVVGCTTGPNNPSFPLDTDQANHALSVMSEHPRPLVRPLVVIGGTWDYLSAPLYKWHFHRISGDDRIVEVSVGFCSSFDECRQMLIDAVDKALPTSDPNFPAEGGRGGASMGGLAARFAAAPSDNPAKPRRLRIARLFSIASPQNGATLVETFGFTQFHRDMQHGSPFLTSLAKCDANARYEMVSYVRLGDGIVGQENAAPPHRVPIWVPTPAFETAHAGALSDPRILADIAKRLRGERPYAQEPLTPLPGVSVAN